MNRENQGTLLELGLEGRLLGMAWWHGLPPWTLARLSLKGYCLVGPPPVKLDVRAECVAS